MHAHYYTGQAYLFNCLLITTQGLFEQFRRVANAYFLLIAVLSVTPVRYAIIHFAES